jgi:hypothetical protein
MDLYAWGMLTSLQFVNPRIIYISEPDACLTLAGYEAGNLGRRNISFLLILFQDISNVPSKHGVSKTRVLKVFASHIAS